MLDPTRLSSRQIGVVSSAERSIEMKPAVHSVSYDQQLKRTKGRKPRESKQSKPSDSVSRGSPLVRGCRTYYESASLLCTSRSTLTRSGEAGGVEVREANTGNVPSTRLRRGLSQLSSWASDVTDKGRTMIKQNEMPITGLVCTRILDIGAPSLGGTLPYRGRYIEGYYLRRRQKS